MLDDRAHLTDAAARRAALLAVLRVGDGTLGCPLGDGDALDADSQPGFVHHDEHGGEAAVLLAHEPADGAAGLAVFHHGRRARVNTELVFEAGADNVVARAHGPIRIDEIARHEKQRDAARAGRRIGESRQDHVNDVFGEVVLAVGDENLGTGDAIAAVAVG